ncbi:MAG: FAD-binding protein [Paludibacteraceae bacterium]|nr:FAD-binding protein [Paludibacteraceae bacterium]
MIKEYDIRVLPQVAADERRLKELLSRDKGLDARHINGVRILKRSIDARQRTVFVNLKVRAFVNEQPTAPELIKTNYHNVSDRPQVIVVGAGPGGLFAALRLIELDFRPIVLERGKNVHERRLDIALISREAKVNSESNYSFGEGGAGAFSDGKLFTRSKKKGNTDRILSIFCLHGANPNILVDVHPHIGTDKLPAVIQAMRERIISCGGEVHFQTRVDELIIKDNEVKGVIATRHYLTVCKQSERSEGSPTQSEFLGPVILATGHSARDVYKMLHNNKVALEPKGIAVGVRLEHPQTLIDQIQYHCPKGRGEYLPPAEYNFVTQVQDRGVYSFCMCPGGFVVPAASGAEQVVVNGMSPSNRGSRWANSGMVVEIRPEDIIPDATTDPLFAVMHYQEEMERMAYINGGRTQVAPAQRMTDFVNRKISFDLPESSYVPGLISAPLHFLLPQGVSDRLKQGFLNFGKWSHGFLTREACLIGVETRTSSPIRIIRDKDTLQHIQIKNLYPCGEGAGYAGGIVSAAIDGERCAEMLAASY